MSHSLRIGTDEVIGTAKDLAGRLETAMAKARNAFGELSGTAGVPASHDQVSRDVATAFDQNAKEFERSADATGQAIARFAETLAQVAQSFAIADSGGGISGLQSLATTLPQQLQALATLPQQIAQAAQASATEDTALASDEDRGDEVAAQGATFA